MRERIEERAAEALLPLTPLSLAVLLALAEGAKHGYALLRSLEEGSGGRLRPGTGTLYAALGRMMEEGVLEEVERPAGEDSRRRYYGVTELGLAVLRAELRRLARLVEAGSALDLLPDLRVVWRGRKG